MSQTRRDFLKTAMTTAAVAAPLMITNSRVWGANDRLNVAGIGIGRQGKNLMQIFMSNEDCNLVAVSDCYAPFRSRALALISEFHRKNSTKNPPLVTDYEDFRQIIGRHDIDAVFIGTPDHWHAYMAVEACKSGKHVYVEKPISVGIDEGRRMVEATAKYKRVVQVGTQQRSSGIFDNAVKLVRSGKLGKVRLVQTGYFGDQPIGVYPDTNSPPGLNWNLWQGPAPLRPFNENRWGVKLNPDRTAMFKENLDQVRWSTFRHYWDYAGGWLGDWGVHLLDIVLWTTDEPGPLEISASGYDAMATPQTDSREIPDSMHVTYTFKNFVCTFEHNPFGNIITRWGPKLDDPKRLSKDHGLLFIFDSGWWLFVNRERWKVISPDGIVPDFFEINGSKIPSIGTDDDYEEIPGHGNHIDNFIDAIQENRDPASTILSGHRATTMCHLGNLSYRASMPIRWDPVNEALVGPDKPDSEHCHGLVYRDHYNGWNIKV